jgi:hypothetical protein
VEELFLLLGVPRSVNFIAMGGCLQKYGFLSIYRGGDATLAIGWTPL